MNVTYIIGNGFDINLKLKTSYANFLNFYIKEPTSTPSLKHYKKLISKDIKTWANLECKLGDITKEFDKKEEFELLVDDIRESLINYLNKELEIFKTEKFQKIDTQKFHLDLDKPEQYLNESDRLNIQRFKSNFKTNNKNIKIINLNYTDTIQSILGSEKNISINGAHYGKEIVLSEIIHVHNTVKLAPIFGVNDISQISNKILLKEREFSLVKPIMNNSLGNLNNSKCQNIIKTSNLICIYGSSIGETDKIWWEEVSNRLLNSDSYLILFHHLEKYDEMNPREMILGINNVKINFLKHLNLTDDQKEVINKKIIVKINSEIFNLYQ